MFDAGSYLRNRPVMLPADAPLEWSVWRTGCAPQFGTESDFKDVDGQRIAHVEFSAGWGAQIFVRAGRPSEARIKSNDSLDARSAAGALVNDLFTAPPLPGVEVISDHEPIATSDAEGAVRLSMRTVPRRLSLRCEGWHLTRLQYVPPKQGFGIVSYLAWMERN